MTRFHRHPEVAASWRPSKGDGPITNLGYTRDRQVDMHKSATADLCGRILRGSRSLSSGRPKAGPVGSRLRMTGLVSSAVGITPRLIERRRELGTTHDGC